MGKATKGKKPIKFSGFEDEIHLSDFIDFKLEYHVGALVLQKKLEGKRIFRFGFETSGIHSCLEEDRFIMAFKNLEEGLKSLPFSEQMTIRVTSFSESHTRTRQLDNLLQKQDNPGIVSLLKSESEKVEELKQRGVRSPKRLRIYVTYDPQRMYERGSSTWQDNFFKSLFKSAKTTVKNLDKKAVERRNKELFVQVYQSGFLQWKRIIQERMGLSLTPLTADDLWQELWDDFSSEPAPPIPQVIRIQQDTQDQTGIGIKYEVEQNSRLSAATILTRQSVPVDDDRWVKVNGRYVGVLTFLEKPSGWTSEREQLSYLWKVLSRDDSGDIEVICQLSTDSEKASRKNLQKFNDQSAVKQKAAKKGSDRMAIRKQTEAEEAEDKLLAGNLPLSVGVSILVYRDDLRRLEEACANIAAQFYAPAWVSREEKIAWKIWSQCLVTCADPLLEKAMYNRRKTYATDEALGFTPVFTTGSKDLDGVELLADDGSSVFINLFDSMNPLNMALFASTRSGKSVLVASFLLQSLARNIPIIALDFPKPDGSSTFSDFTKVMGKDGAYYDITKESNNIIQYPDLRKIHPEKVKDHIAHFTSSLKQIIMTLVGTGEAIDDDIKTILMPLINTFLAREDIKQRFELAINKGINTPEWDNTPTLHDFKEHVPVKDETDSADGQKVLDIIHRKLKYWLNSEIANAIAKPSSFEADSKLLVFALTNVSDDQHAAILGLAAYSAAMRRALSFNDSIFFIDESPILFQFPMISQLIANLTANFGKAGGRVIITAQTASAIAQSGHAAQILGNCKVKLVGCTEPDQVDSLVTHLKMDPEQAKITSSEGFIRKRGEDWSNWMLSYGGKMYKVRFYPGQKLLYSVANNSVEQKVREFFMKNFPIDIALDATGLHLQNCVSQNLDPLEFLPNEEQVQLAKQELEKVV